MCGLAKLGHSFVARETMHTEMCAIAPMKYIRLSSVEDVITHRSVWLHLQQFYLVCHFFQFCKFLC